MRLAALLLILLSTTAHASSITIAVPDAQDATVVAGRDAYNTRTGQALTTKQWILQVMRASVISELSQQQQAIADAAAASAAATYKATLAAQDALVQQTTDSNSTATWGLPATPAPPPRPTPTVPVFP